MPLFYSFITPQSPSPRNPHAVGPAPGTPASCGTCHLGQAFERSGGKIGKGMLCVEYADHGTGDFRAPSFTVIDNANGSSISPLRYTI